MQVAAGGGNVQVAERGHTKRIFAPRSIAWLAWACLSQCGETSEAFFRPAFLAATCKLMRFG